MQNNIAKGNILKTSEQEPCLLVLKIDIPNKIFSGNKLALVTTVQKEQGKFFTSLAFVEDESKQLWEIIPAIGIKPMPALETFATIAQVPIDTIDAFMADPHIQIQLVQLIQQFA